MGITSAWAISSHNDSVTDELAPRVLPLIAAERQDPRAQESRRLWHRSPLPDHRTWYGPPTAGDPLTEAVASFLQLTAGGEHIQQLYDGMCPDDGFRLVHDVWERDESPEQMFLSIQSKDYALASFFHAIGPRRAALIPGWCGSFLLTATEVRSTLPRVERALSFGQEERAAAEAQDWLDYAPDEETVLTGPLRQWRQAAEAGLGLCGVNLHIY
ncbi:hypothetical protein IPZ58_29970 [Streptomyces roseoverticillatus]|uniref:hypothetical protein n=1 Tax=Streptomyces roseoverticillatus TaxID=66429 RepID=UPI001F29FE95|nr:hypothetical protein [Streptomyces roseoverticillatus]MCF3105782.1 hypothetical protein [Streptomyces roseoverticillatus]